MKFSLLVLALTICGLSQAAIKVITSTTDLAWATQEIGGQHVEVKALLNGNENPHYVDAVPEFIRLAAEAQAAIIVGLDLEIGWVPKVLARSGNAQVQPGGKGYCETGKAIKVLEKPAGEVDRSMGDVHPSGNPHFWLSPEYFAQGAGAIVKTLSAVDPAHAADYQANYKKFQEAMLALQKKGQARIKPLLVGTTGPVMLEYHKEFAYFLESYGLKSAGSIEEKPGVSPSAGRLAEVAVAAKASGVKFALAADTSPRKTIERFRELSGLSVTVVPMSVVPRSKPKTYPELQEILVDAVVKGLSGGKAE